MIDLVKVYEDIVRSLTEGGRIRAGIAEILSGLDKVLESGKPFVVFLNLPTGYGKTTLSLALAKALYEYGNELPYARMLHVIPTRYLAEDILSKANEIGIKASAQYMFADPSVKAPYFLRKFIVTTYDSYVLNFYKACVARIRSYYGHFEVPRYGILTSLTFFDEYHLFTPGDTVERDEKFDARAWTALTRTIKQLIKKAVPIVLSTATLIENYQQYLLDIISRYGLTKTECFVFNITYQGADKVTKNRINLIYVQDREYYDLVKQVRICTYLHKVRSVDDFLKTTKSIIREKRYNKILICCNTVELAQKVYCELKNLGRNVVLLHSKLTTEDREARIKCIEELSKTRQVTIVATQVIEVGVDLDADMLISEVAPLPALVQRAGRIIRRLEERNKLNKLEGEYHIIAIEERFTGKTYSGVYRGDITKKTLDTLDRVHREYEIEWKVPLSYENRKSYVELAKEIHSDQTVTEDYTYDLLLRSIDEDLLIDQATVHSLLREVCSYVREDVAVPVYVPEEGDPQKVKQEIENKESKDLVRRMFSIEGRKLARTLRERPDILFRHDNSIVCIFESHRGELVLRPDRRLVDIIAKLDTEHYTCQLFDYVVSEGEQTYYLIALLLNPKYYDPELGLTLWS